MFRSPSVNPSDYDVEIGTGAWSQVARLPEPSFERIRTELQRRGELAGVERQMVAATSGPTRNHVLIVDAYAVTYRVDDAKRMVTLLAVQVREQERD